jgi:hypothetical protein
MAKTPATVERFVIHAETSKDDMGHVVAELIKRGLTNVGYELITDVVTFRKNGARKAHDVTGNDFARAFLKENASFAAIQIVKHFQANDRTDGMAYKAIRELVKEGALKKLGPGNYQRAGVKALPAPKGKRPATHTGPRQEIGNKDVILKRIKGRRRFTLRELREHFANIKRNPHSVSPIISKLFHAKLVTQIEDGVYAWGNVKTKKVAKKIQAAVRKKRDAPVAQASSPLERTNG